MKKGNTTYYILAFFIIITSVLFCINLLLEEKGKQSTPDLFKKIIKLLDLPESTFDQKIGDYYTSLTTDKRFILLEDGKWDLRSRHTSDKVIKVDDEEDEE